MESPSKRTLGSRVSTCCGRTSHVHSISSAIDLFGCAIVRAGMKSIPRARDVTQPCRSETRRLLLKMAINAESLRKDYDVKRHGHCGSNINFAAELAST